MTQPATDLSALSFEEALRELDTIVKQLEEGRITLEEAMTAYEKGSALKAHCEAKLQDARLRLEKILPPSEPGTAPTASQAFDESAAT